MAYVIQNLHAVPGIAWSAMMDFSTEALENKKNHLVTR